MVKRTPIRTCVACRQTSEKRSLLRFVRTRDGSVQLDLTGKLAGRGAYVCDSEDCLTKALLGSLEKALNVRLAQEEKERLTAEFAGR